MKKIKKIAASIMAVVAMATSMVGISADAAIMNATSKKDFYLDGYKCTATLEIGTTGNYYGASTYSASSAITGRQVYLHCNCIHGINTMSVDDSGYSDTGYATAQIYAPTNYSFISGTGGSSHKARHGSNSGSTYFSF